MFLDKVEIILIRIDSTARMQNTAKFMQLMTIRALNHDPTTIPWYISIRDYFTSCIYCTGKDSSIGIVDIEAEVKDAD